MSNGGFTTNDTELPDGKVSIDTEATRSFTQEFELQLKSWCTVPDVNLKQNESNVKPRLEKGVDSTLAQFESELRSFCTTSRSQLNVENRKDPVKEFETMLQTYLVRTDRITPCSEEPNRKKLSEVQDASRKEAVIGNRKRFSEVISPDKVIDRNNNLVKRSRQNTECVGTVAERELKKSIAAKRSRQNTECVGTVAERELKKSIAEFDAVLQKTLIVQSRIEPQQCYDGTKSSNFQKTTSVDHADQPCKIPTTDNPALVEVAPNNYITVEQLIHELQIAVHQPEFHKALVEIDNTFSSEKTVSKKTDDTNYLTLEQLQFELDLAANLPLKTPPIDKKKVIVVRNELLDRATNVNEIPYDNSGAVELTDAEKSSNEEKVMASIDNLFPEEDLEACEALDRQEMLRGLLKIGESLVKNNTSKNKPKTTRSNKASKTNPPKCRKNRTVDENVAPKLPVIGYVKDTNSNAYFYVEHGNSNADNNHSGQESKLSGKTRKNSRKILGEIKNGTEKVIRKKVGRPAIKRVVPSVGRPKIDEKSDYYPHLLELSIFIKEKLQLIKEFQVKTVNKMVYGKESNDVAGELLGHINSSQEDYDKLLESQELLSQQSVSFAPSFVELSTVKVSANDGKKEKERKTRLSDALDDIFKDASLINQEGAQELYVPPEVKARKVLQKIAEVYTGILKDIETGFFPEFKMRNRIDWDNVIFANNRLLPKPVTKFSLIKYSKKQSRNKFGLVVRVFGKIVDLMISNSTCTKRELYYQLVQYARNHRQVDEVIVAITTIIDTPTWDFGVYATGKGLVYGNLTLHFTDGTLVSCLVSGGVQIPYRLHDITKIVSNASFIIIVEKDSVFQKLLDEDLPNKLAYPFILVTGKGFSDINTRLFVRKIWQSAAIPIFVLVDCDPFGIEIMLNYRYGSLNQAHFSDYLAIPQLRWLGVHPSELVSMGVNTFPMSELDRDKLDQLLSRPFINAVPKIREELLILKRHGKKAEIEGIIKSTNFLRNYYLPMKLCDKDYI